MIILSTRDPPASNQKAFFLLPDPPIPAGSSAAPADITAIRVALTVTLNCFPKNIKCLFYFIYFLLMLNELYEFIF